ncbi:MAG: RNA polymerase sigma factor [bacterium]
MEVNEVNKEFVDFLNKCKKKEEKAWDFFVEKYANLIYQYIIKTLRRYSYSFQEDEVDDIFHNVFLALLDEDCKRLKKFRGHDEYSFLAYLRVISFNKAIDYLRKQKTFIELEKIQHRTSDQNNIDGSNYRDLKDIILMIKEDLPERHNYLFKLIYEEGFVFSEIAEIMNIKINAVHQLKFRMIQNIHKIARKKDLYQVLKYF